MANIPRARETHDIMGTKPNASLPKNSVRLPVIQKLSPPEFLSTMAKIHWRKTFKLLSDCRVITKNDLDVLEIYCESYATWKEATIALRAKGLLDITARGGQQPSAYISIINMAHNQLKGMIVQLGLSPAARARLEPVAEEMGEDDWSNL